MKREMIIQPIMACLTLGIIEGKWRYFLVIASLLIVQSCGFRKYSSKPIDAHKLVESYENRSLDNLDLKKLVTVHTGSVIEDKWSVEALTIAAFFYHPDLDVARQQLEIQKAREITAGQKPNPRVGANIGYNYTPGEVPIKPWLITPSLDFIIETAGKRRYRINQARFQIESTKLNLGVVAWQVRSLMRARLVNYLFEQELSGLIREEVRLRGEFIDSLQTLYKFGEITITDMELPRINANNAVQRLAVSEGMVSENLVQLANSIGLTPQALEGKQIAFPQLFEENGSIALDTIDVAALRNNLSVQKGLMDYAVSEALLRLEVANQYPDIQLGTSLRFYQGERRFQFSPGVDLPVFNRNQGPIAEAVANRELQATSFLQLQANIISEIYRTRALHVSYLKEYYTVKSIVTSNQNRLQQVLEVFSLGDATYMDVLSARIELLVARQAMLQALRKLKLNIGTIEDVVQKPLLETINSLPNFEINPRTQSIK